MGSVLGTVMDENMKKNQEFMVENQKLTLARQMQIQRQMQKRQMATMLAGSREMFNWIASFYGLATVAMFAGYMKSKKPSTLAPFLPLTFMVGYQADYVYGNKIDRIRDEAERIMREEQGLLAVPSGMPTFNDLEEGRLAAEGCRWVTDAVQRSLMGYKCATYAHKLMSQAVHGALGTTPTKSRDNPQSTFTFSRTR